MRSRATVVALDATNAQNAYRLPYRTPTRFTPRVLPLTYDVRVTAPRLVDVLREAIDLRASFTY